MNQRTNYPFSQTKRRPRRQVVLNLGHLDFEIVSDFDIRISDLCLLANSLPNMMIQPTQLCGYVVPAGLFMAVLCLLPSVLRIFTTVERPLQISSFMQNKANFLESQVNVTKVLTRYYEKRTLGGSGKNKANTKPIKANLLDAQMNISSVLTKDYENERLCRRGENKPNQTQFPKNPDNYSSLF